MDSSGREGTAPARAGALCLACGNAIDPLRAGQVAIIDGAFRYFCDAACKGTYVEAVSKRPVFDAVTAAPPPVATAAPPPVILAVIPPPVIAPLELDEIEEAKDEVEANANAQEHLESDAVTTLPSVEPREPSENFDAAPVLTLRSPAPASPRELMLPRPTDVTTQATTTPPTPPTSSEQILSLAPLVGVAAGLLASVVSLAGDVMATFRLPLALLAVSMLFVRRFATSGREAPTELLPARLLVLMPTGVGAMIATLSTLMHHPHSDTHAIFVALAASSALGVELILGRAYRDLVALRAQTVRALSTKARVVRGECVEQLEAADVKPGEQVLVEANETIPVDGVVLAFEAEVSPWLDSPAIVTKKEGDAVVAGAVVMSGRIRINATFTGTDRAWLRLTHSGRGIERAAPYVAFMRRAVELGALAGAVLLALAVYANKGTWADVAIAACAGGFVLSAATAVSAAALAHAHAHRSAQRRGIVYKDALSFDLAARADIAVMCSRGTLLRGEPEIVAVEAITKDGPTSRADADSSEERANPVERILAIAAGAEMSSTHPFALAVLREARARGIAPDNMRSVMGHSGLGVTGLSANGDRVIVGSRAFLLQEKISVALADARAAELEAEGRSVLLVAVGARLVGLLALQDGLRAGARAAVQKMHDAHIEPVLLSGEARDTCETIGRALDIEHVRPEILPADRGAEVRALADGGHVVAALGHASTDDGALGAADVSVAMEAAGAAPGEWGVAMASDDVRDAVLALTIPRACRDRARLALIIGGLGQAAAALAVAFGLSSTALVPVVGFLTTVAVLAVVRDQQSIFD